METLMYESLTVTTFLNFKDSIRPSKFSLAASTTSVFSASSESTVIPKNAIMMPKLPNNQKGRPNPPAE